MLPQLDQSIALKIPANTRCAACGDNKPEPFAVTSDYAHETSNDEFAYLRCGVCKTIFLMAPPAPEQLGQYYPTSYAQHQFGGERATRNFLDRLGESLHGRVCSRYPFLLLRKNFFESMTTNDLFLDYGCGAGEALDEARMRGATTVGIDFVPSVIDELKKREHKAFLADSDWVNQMIALGGVSKVRLNHSLEHVHNPQALLHQIARAAKSGCQLQLSVPNPEGLSANLFKRNWMGLEPPRHLVLASSSQIHRFLRNAGFRVTAVCTEPTGKDVARSLAISAWRLGWMTDKNQVRNFHRKGWALILGLPIGMIATLFGRGDRLHIYGVRQ